MNKCMFIGNVGKDPEIINLESGTTLAKFSLACTERYKNKQGEKVENTEWINCIAWEKRAEVIESYVHKGDKLFVEGKFTTRKWEDKDGNSRYTTEVIVNSMEMLGGKKSEPSSGSASDSTRKAPDTATAKSDEEDDLPF